MRDVYWDSKKGKWKAQARINGKIIQIGYYSKIKEAVVIRRFVESLINRKFAGEPSVHTYNKDTNTWTSKRLEIAVV